MQEIDAAPEEVRRRSMPPHLTPEQKEIYLGKRERPRLQRYDPWGFDAQESRLLRAVGEDRPEPVSGEGVPLAERVLERATAAARNSKVYGPEHWKRVAVAGVELCREMPGADPLVVLRFALLHDSQRYTDSTDPGHGRRGGALARELLRGDEALSAAQVDQVVKACALHTAGQTTPDPTIGVCWDADRLNLWRVGSRPDPAFLSTEAAGTLERIEWARELQGQPFTWAEIFESYREFDPDKKGEPGA